MMPKPMTITQNSVAICSASSPAGSSDDWTPLHDARSGRVTARAVSSGNGRRRFRACVVGADGKSIPLRAFGV